MRRMSLSSVALLCLLLAGGCPPEDDKEAKDAGSDPGQGGDNSGGASDSDEASSGNNGAGGNGNAGESDACATVRCAGGTHCQVTEVECIQAPCDPVVECVPDDTAGCELIDCAPDHICIEDDRGSGTCVPANTDDACTLTCEKGKHCDFVEVTCVKAPCNPVQQCVEDDACTGFKCDDGKHCELLPVPCPKKPGALLPPACEPQPACVVDVKCGNNTCTNGQQCCNASCGICADPGVACTQIAC